MCACMYVSVCSFLLFSFDLLAGGRILKLPNRSWVISFPLTPLSVGS